MNTVANLSVQLVTATLGLRCSTAVDLDATAEAENLRTVQAEIDEFGDHAAVMNMVAGMMATAIIAIGRADDRDPMLIWQKAMVGLASDDE